MRAWFSVTLFVSAALLFMIQPMVARMLLPLLGGSPAVWNTCMVFFQALLLLGYAYAHGAPAWLGVRRHAVVHLVVLLLPFLVLPLRLPSGTPPVDSSPIPWLLGVLLYGTGLPFLVLSTGAPLLQRWFAHTGHHERDDPYFLYGASNLGSLFGLLSYPLLVEPLLTLAHQRVLWAVGYGVLVGLVAGCAVFVLRSSAAGAGEAEAQVAAVPAPSDSSARLGLWRRLRWVALAFVPSSLMLGVTSAITTDMAAIPLMWVIPLALYLTSFIVTFSRPAPAVHRWMVAMLPLALVGLALTRIFQPGLVAMIAIHLCAFFVTAMVCHGELASDRPSSRHLTEFYLWLAIGGVLGGALNALLAPLAFDRLIEYPLVGALACLLLPGPSKQTKAEVRPPAAARREAKARQKGARPARAAAPARGGLRLGPRLLWASFGIVMALVFTIQSIGDPRLVIRSERNFYGIVRVKFDPFHDLVAFLHGTTVHGLQSVVNERREEPLSYFSRSGPIGQVFAALGGERRPRKVAVFGLGIGTLASYMGPGQELEFYEIDPAVERLARDTTYFSYLADAAVRGARVGVQLGDARLRFRQSRERYDLIVLDAFSSDVLPVHLITREALREYLDRLEEGGAIAVNVSSQSFRLERVLSTLARDAGLVCLFQHHRVALQEQVERGISGSRWVVMARRVEDLAGLASDPRWLRMEGSPADRVWTDDYANVVGALIWRKGSGAL